MTLLAITAALAASGQTSIEALHVPELDAGFHLLYELEPEEARNRFETRHESDPEDPLGSASVAASYLFEECIQQGILTSEFFLDDKRFLGNIPLKPDPTLRAAFFAADKQAQDLAQQRLRTNPDDTNALFSMTISLGTNKSVSEDPAQSPGDEAQHSCLRRMSPKSRLQTVAREKPVRFDS